jgi:hypothetical protein
MLPQHQQEQGRRACRQQAGQRLPVADAGQRQRPQEGHPADGLAERGARNLDRGRPDEADGGGRPLPRCLERPPSCRIFGRKGGMVLTKAPSALTILEVVNAVEPLGRIRECPLGLTAHGVRLCPVHKRLDNALALVEEAFRQTTLAEILAEPTGSRPLCEFPSSRLSLKS